MAGKTVHAQKILLNLIQTSKNNKGYNIPRACLLDRSPVPAMDLKSNRSGLWCHMLETCRRLRRLRRKRSNNVARHDKTPVKSTVLSRDMIKLQLSQHFCRATWVSCRVGVTLCCDFYTFRSCNTCTFSLPTFARLRHTTWFFGVVWYIIKHL